MARLTTQLGYPVEEAEQGERLADLLADPDDHAVLVAVDEADRPIGWAHVERQRVLEVARTAVLMGLVVDEGHRSTGVGSALLGAAEKHALGWGCRAVLVRSRMSRERAHRFYAREGYRLWKTSHVFEKRFGEGDR